MQLRHIISFWSATPVQETNLFPVLRLYASASFLSLQGNHFTRG
ncbi:hypothetical protein ACUN24_04905 [Pedobacter sp. WC2501]